MRTHKAKLSILVFLSLASCCSFLIAPALANPPSPSTFSIAAADPETGEVGVAVASRFFSVGSVVPWARAGAGAIATQSYANTAYGPKGLALLEKGTSPAGVLELLTKPDQERERRQV